MFAIAGGIILAYFGLMIGLVILNLAITYFAEIISLIIICIIIAFLFSLIKEYSNEIGYLVNFLAYAFGRFIGISFLCCVVWVIIDTIFPDKKDEAVDEKK